MMHARIQKVLSEGVQLWLFFFKLMRRERTQIPLYAVHHRPASETSCKWRFAGRPMVTQHRMLECWLGSFVVLQGIRTSIAKKPYIVVIFQEGGSRPPVPLWIRTCDASYDSCLFSVIFFSGSILQCWIATEAGEVWKPDGLWRER